MEPTGTTPETRAFCSECGAKLDVGARFCHHCGVPVAGGERLDAPRRAAPPRAGDSRGEGSLGGLPRTLAWAVPVAAVIAMIVIVAVRSGSTDQAPATPLGAVPPGVVRAPDISSLTPQERADRLFNRVMRLDSEGHADSAAFFGPMALGAFEALAPYTPHVRYDVGLVALVTGRVDLAKAQVDSLLAERPTHLLGLSLAARVAEARGDSAAAVAFRRRLVAAEGAERRSGLQEYTDHDADIKAALELARTR